MSRDDRLQQLLLEQIQPQHIEILNESHMHSGPATESHYKVTLVAEAFSGLNRVKRHQLVYGLVQAELNQGMHAIALHLYTPEEWQDKQVSPDSPQCRGGSKNS